MIDDLRALFGRTSLVELILAFALASAVVSLVNALAEGLVLSPITSHEPPSWSDLSFDLGHRSFRLIEIAQALAVLAIVAALAVLFARRATHELWEDAPPAECPHCLSEISGAAKVCPYCTRDLA